MNQHYIEDPARYYGNSMLESQYSASTPYGLPMDNSTAQPPYHGATLGMPNSGLMHGMAPPIIPPPRNPPYETQDPHQMLAHQYPARQWQAGGVMYNAPPHLGSVSFHVHQQFDGMSPTQNLGMGTSHSLSHHGWRNSARAGDSSMETRRYQRTENNTLMNGSGGRKRKQVEEDDYEDSSVDDDEEVNGPASKRARRI